MNRTVKEICDAIDRCTEGDQKIILSQLRDRFTLHPLESQWNIKAEVILNAIGRASDLTVRGVRGIIAEAIFADSVAPSLSSSWKIEELRGDYAYDFKFISRADGSEVRVQVKLQRQEKQRPLLISMAQRQLLQDAPETLYVVEIQKTRAGKRRKKVQTNGQVIGEVTEEYEDTRPYRFGEFDIVAVSMHPATGDWKRFMYTLSDWLLPAFDKPDQIQTLQPVAEHPDLYWTDSLEQCMEWLSRRESKRLYNGRPTAPRRLKKLADSRQQKSLAKKRSSQQK